MGLGCGMSSGALHMSNTTMLILMQVLIAVSARPLLPNLSFAVLHSWFASCNSSTECYNRLRRGGYQGDWGAGWMPMHLASGA